MNKEQIIQILKENYITYYTEGKNVSVNSINVNCIFCPDTDPSNHLGILPDNGYVFYNCWRCGARGSTFYLLSRLLGVPVEVIKSQLIEQSNESVLTRINNIIHPKIEEDEDDEPNVKIEMPECCEIISHNTNNIMLAKWLERRGYSLNDLIHYKCGVCRFGNFANRLIIPVYEKGELYAYQGASLVTNAECKYLMSKGNKINNFLYNFDKLESNKYIILTEGVLDAWRVGKNAVCTFGTHLTKKQYNKIKDLKPKKIIIAWDNDAYFKARELAKSLEMISEVKIVYMPDNHDPDSYGKQYGQYKLYELLGV
jgi:hypothetical protein